MSKDDKFYTVIYVLNGRMYPCKCGMAGLPAHETPESAQACEKFKDAVSIMEWVKNRDPQFQEYWRSPDIDK
jgi:hypothetical protein